MTLFKEMKPSSEDGMGGIQSKRPGETQVWHVPCKEEEAGDLESHRVQVQETNTVTDLRK